MIVSNLKTNANAIADAGCAMQNIMLMAHSLGVASCWINQMKDTNGDPAVRALLDGYGVPADHDVQCCAALGYGNPAREIEHSMTAVHYV